VAFSETSTAPAPPPTVGRGAVRVVLFGMPAAGKTSLLGALDQAAQTQEHLLNGRLQDRGQGLAELQQRLYEERGRPTTEEVVLYPVEFEPFGAEGAETPGRLKAVLIDCDGRVVNDLLVRRRALREDSPEGTLAREVIEADTLLLVIDASAAPAQVDADFAEFGRFLRLLERSRGQRTEVGGLPVFLVLTKCDLLARPDDTPAGWMERIEERKRQVHARFQEFFSRQTGADGQWAFGRINLQLWATAVKRPPLAGVPAKPREPYGVAELFRLCLEAARDFHRRRLQSGRRLAWMVGGSAGLIALLAALVVALSAGNRDHGPDPLLIRVQNYRAREDPAARFTGTADQLRRRAAELAAIEKDPGFAALPPEEQAYVHNRRKELQDYAQYREVIGRIPSPAEARGERELERIEKELAEHPPPEAYRKEWEATDAARERADKLQDARALLNALQEVDDWYRKLAREGEQLLSFSGGQTGTADPDFWGKWQGEADRLFKEAENTPYREARSLPDARSPNLTYGTVRDFRQVQEARERWESVKQRLQRLRDLGAALGLAGASPEAAPLQIPGPGDLEGERRRAFLYDLATAGARRRVQELKKTYPKFEEQFVLTGLPPKAQDVLRRAARGRYDNLIAAGREVVLRHLQQVSPDGRETYAGWRALLPWLSDPKDLQDWRVLARVLARLQDPDAPDPVSALAAFVGEKEFRLEMRQLTLEVPYRLHAEPAGSLRIYHPPTTKDGPALEFEVLGDRRKDDERRVTTYTFRPVKGSRLTYRPGDELYATLELRDTRDNGAYAFAWVRGRSAVYQFEHLVREPRFHRKDQDYTKGSLAEDARLSVPPGQGEIPPVPDLVPVVRLEKR
jgi:hypothetical protein